MDYSEQQLLKQTSVFFVFLLSMGNIQADDRVELFQTQIKTLRHASKALLNARLTKKQEIKNVSTEDREDLNKLYSIVNRLEKQLIEDQYMVSSSSNPLTTVVGGSALILQPTKTTTFRFQPDSHSFIHEQIAPPKKSGLINASVPVSNESARSSVETKQTIHEKAYANARTAITLLKSQLNEKYSKPQETVLQNHIVQRKTPRGNTNRRPNTISPVDIRRTIDRGSLLKQLVEDAEDTIVNIETDNVQGLRKIRQFKQRLSLSKTGGSLVNDQPTVVSASQHHAPKNPNLRAPHK